MQDNQNIISNQQLKFKVKVPGTSANLGCGFDTLSIALTLYMTTRVGIIESNGNSTDSDKDLSKWIVIKYKSDKRYNKESVIPLNPNENYLTKTLDNIIRVDMKYGVEWTRRFIGVGHKLELDIENDIPVGRGMGSSAATIVTALSIANQLCGFQWTRDQIFQRSIKYEPSADNLSSAIFGGFNIVVCHQQQKEEGKESVPKDNNDDDNIIMCRTTPLPLNMKSVLVIPHFQVLTMQARSVLPSSYSKQDVIYNLQRISMLTNILSTMCYSIPSPSNPTSSSSSTSMSSPPPQSKSSLSMLTSHSIMDRIHQPYRGKLIPGYNEIISLNSQTPSLNGLLGVCISGSGPTILALSISNHTEISDTIQKIFKNNNIDSDTEIVEFDNQGTLISTL